MKFIKISCNIKKPILKNIGFFLYLFSNVPILLAQSEHNNLLL